MTKISTMPHDSLAPRETLLAHFMGFREGVNFRETVNFR